MRKFLSRVISALMPTKMARYRVRGIIEFGPVRALKLYRKVRRMQNTPRYKLAVCLIAKNEAPYFAEWIEYHKLMGVEKFYIYDNESTDNTREILQPYIDDGLVEYSVVSGYKPQLTTYNKCLADHRFDAQWIAFIDIDEFIVPLRHDNIPDFLDEFKEFSAVQINWLCYGSGGQEKHEPGLVTERFRDHSEHNHPLNCHVKSIVQPTRVVGFSGAHESVRLYGKAANPEKGIVKKHYRDSVTFGMDIIRINHYAVKSHEEYAFKRNRGRVRTGNSYEDTYFERFDRNEIKDDPTMDKYIPIIKEKLASK